MTGWLSLAVLLAAPGVATASQQVTSAGVAFGSYDVGSLGESRAKGSVTISCDVDCPTAYTLTLGASLYGGSPAQRLMKHSSKDKYLTYSMALDNGGGSWAQSVTRTFAAGTPLTVEVSGVILQGQNVPAGSFSDRVTVTLEW